MPTLDLSSKQRLRIQELDESWRRERDSLTVAMRGFQPAPGNLETIKSGLQDYSSLSRQYDSTRERLWLSALAILNPAQRSHALGGAK